MFGKQALLYAARLLMLLAWHWNDDVDVVIGVLLQDPLRQLGAHVQPRCASHDQHDTKTRNTRTSRTRMTWERRARFCAEDEEENGLYRCMLCRNFRFLGIQQRFASE